MNYNVNSRRPTDASFFEPEVNFKHMLLAVEIWIWLWGIA